MRDGVFHCPVEVSMDVLAGKWTVVVLAHLKDEVLRFSELRRRMPDITDKMLTQRLRALEDDGIVERNVVAATPPHVEYRLTDEGESLRPVLDALYAWGELWATRRSFSVVNPTRDVGDR